MLRTLAASFLLVLCAGCFSDQAATTPTVDSRPPLEAVSKAASSKDDWPEKPASHLTADRNPANDHLVLDDEEAFAAALGKLAATAAEHEGAAEYDAAQEVRRELLDKLERRYGSKSWQAANGRLALAHVGRLAELTFEERGKLLAIGEAERWSASLAAQGQLTEALAEAQRAVALTRELWGEEYYLTGNRWFDEAQIQHALEAYDVAETLYRQTLASRKKTFGREHPEYVSVLNALAAHYQAIPDYARAEKALREATELDQILWGDSHPTYATQLNNLGMVYQSLGKPREAVELLQRSADIRRQALGAKSPLYGHSLYNLASVHYAARQLDQAAPLFEEALPIVAAELGPHHQMTLLAKNNLAMVELDRKDATRAASLLSEVADAVREQSGDNSVAYASVLQQLAVVYSHQLKYRESDELLVQAQEIHEQALGRDHELVGKILEMRATILRHAKRPADAERLEARAKSIARVVENRRR